MTPREKGFERLRQEARNAHLLGLMFVLLGIGMGLGFVLIFPPDGDGGGILIDLFVLSFLGAMAWMSAHKFSGLKRNRLLELDRLAEVKPFYEAYRNGKTLSGTIPQKNDDLRRLREKYHQLKEAVEVQLKAHKEEKELLQKTGKIEDAQGMAALILDLEDAEKQLQKELSIIERGFQPVQPPHVMADRSPVGRMDSTSETGLEGY